MKIVRNLNNLIKTNEFLFIIAAYFFYVIVITLTASDMTDSMYESLTYFIYVHFALMPCYLFFIGKHDTYVNSLYCYVRFKGQRDAYFARIGYLAVESIIFVLPYIFIIFIFAFTSNAAVSIGGLLLSGLNTFLHFLMVGLVACAVSVRWRRDFLGGLVAFLILCVDFMLVSGLLMEDFSFFYVPMLEVFTFSDTINILKTVLISLVKVVVIFVCTYSMFLFKTKQVD